MIDRLKSNAKPESGKKEGKQEIGRKMTPCAVGKIMV